MILAAEQLGWLWSYAEGQDKTWAQRFKDSKKPVPYVDVIGGEYLEVMLDMGPIVNNGAGLVARSDAEITDYLRGMGAESTPGDFSLLRKMCRGYLAGMKTGNDKFGIPPAKRQNTVEGD